MEQGAQSSQAGNTNRKLCKSLCKSKSCLVGEIKPGGQAWETFRVMDLWGLFGLSHRCGVRIHVGVTTAENSKDEKQLSSTDR